MLVVGKDLTHFFMLVLMMQMESTVGDVMSSPAITLTTEKTVLGNLCSP